MKKEKLKIQFGDFWPNFNKHDNFFTQILSKKYDLHICDDPDFYFFTHSYNGNTDYLKFKCHRVFLGWENERADWKIADYVLDSDLIANNPRHKRFPIWAAWDLSLLTNPKSLKNLDDKKFCCMVVSNPKAKERIDFFHKLSKYKKVDSGGRVLNNIGGPVANKKNFIKDYKFVISFENSSYPGYTTEKLIEPMYVNSVPIYWGNPEVGKDFNTQSFIHINDFSNFDEAIQYIIQLDNDDEMYARLFQQPWLNKNKVPDEMSSESMLHFFEYIIKDSKVKKPVATSLFNSGMHRVSSLQKKIKSSLRHRFGIEKGFR